MSNKTAEIRFGGEQNDFLSISVRGRAFRQSKDYWDGNWLLVTVTLHAGKFSGEVPGMLRAEELQKFSGELQAHEAAVKRTISFETAEEWLAFRVEADKPGIILIAGTIRDEVGYPYNSLKFTLKTQPGALTAALQQLQQVVKAFPVVGKS